MEACHLVSHRKPLFVIFNWFPCLMGCSVRSSGHLLIAHAITWPLTLRPIAQAILSLVSLLHFRGTWIYSCISSWRLGSLLWLHDLFIEHAVSRECEGFMINNSHHGAGHRPVTICPTSRTQCGLTSAMVTKVQEGGATLSKRFMRASLTKEFGCMNLRRQTLFS